MVYNMQSQAAVLLALGNAALTVWGASPTSALRADAAAFLLVRAAGAPATVLLLVLQVGLHYPNGEGSDKGLGLGFGWWCTHS